MAFSGLWETWHAKDAKGATEEIISCCIFTTGSNAQMQTIHARMPVIIAPEQFDLWLAPQEKQIDHLLPMIRSYDSAPMQAWPVTREVNKVGLRDDAGLAGKLNFF